MLNVILILIGVVAIIDWKLINDRKNNKDFNEFNEKVKENQDE